MKQPYKPLPCQGDKAEFSGNVVLRLPAYEERMEIMVECDFLDMTSEEGKVTGSKKQQVKSMLKLVKASYEFYEKVDIKRKSDGKAFKSLEDLRYDHSCAEILQDVANWLLNGGGSKVEGKS